MNCRGMTLLEVMVAIAILAIAGLSLLNLSGNQLRNLSYLEQKQLASWVAENQLSQLFLQQIWPAESWHYGSSEMAGERWYWRWRGVSTSDAKLRALEVEVRLNKNSPSALIQLKSYRVRS